MTKKRLPPPYYRQDNLQRSRYNMLCSIELMDIFSRMLSEQKPRASKSSTIERLIEDEILAKGSPAIISELRELQKNRVYKPQ